MGETVINEDPGKSSMVGCLDDSIQSGSYLLDIPPVSR